MAQKNEIFAHFGGQKEVCRLDLAEELNIRSFIERLSKDGHLPESKPEDWIACLEDAEDELPLDYPLEVGKHKRIHISRCKKVDVTVIFNGAPKSHHFLPGTTLRKVTHWAREQFGVDKKEKLVLRADNTESEPLDPDSHVGSYVSHNHCKVTFYLTPTHKING